MASEPTFDRIRQDIEDAKNSEGLISVNVSGGLASSIVWKRCVDWFGTERVVPCFADTCSESPETYDFLADCERFVGQRLNVLWTDRESWDIRVGLLSSDRSNGAHIWDCFFKHRMTKVQSAGGACKASIDLKRKPLDWFHRVTRSEFLAVGLQCEETDRMARLERHKPDHKIIYPVAVFGAVSRCSAIREVESWGINVPPAYSEGFEHNNCQQFGCILQGNAQWAGTLEAHPEVFARTEKLSEQFREETGFALCRDRRGGIVKPLTLVQIREEVERGERFAGDWQSTCGCMIQGELFDRTDEGSGDGE